MLTLFLSLNNFWKNIFTEKIEKKFFLGYLGMRKIQLVQVTVRDEMWQSKWNEDLDELNEYWPSIYDTF